MHFQCVCLTQGLEDRGYKVNYLFTVKTKKALKLWGFLLASAHRCISQRLRVKEAADYSLFSESFGDLGTVRGPDGVFEEKLRFKNEKRK